MRKVHVMLILEGTYPYNGGGVSTWAHTLCRQTENVDFTLCVLTANYCLKPKYSLPPSIKHIIQVPLWAADEPASYPNYHLPYHTTLKKQEKTTAQVVSLKFIPLFESLLNHIYDDQDNMESLDDLFFRLWTYFQTYDYSKTLKDECVWRSYLHFMNQNGAGGNIPTSVIMDLIISMGWLYRLLVPLSIEVPRVDLVHLTMSGFTILPALIASYAHNTPILLTEHGVFIRERLLAINSSGYSFFLKDFLIRFSECIARLAYYKSDRIVSVNSFNHQWERRYGADPDKLQIIHNGIDHARFIPRSKPPHLRDVPTVVALARIFELKDIETMIRTCAIVKKKIPNVRFLVYGDDQSVPEYTKTCRSLIAKLGLEDNFLIEGARPNPHLLFPEGDISVLTSISEGFPYTVLESMSCGVPVVATDVGGTSEALDHGASGFICKPKDVSAIAGRILQLLADPGLRKKMGTHARNRIITHFSEAHFILAYQEVYQTATMPMEKYKIQTSLSKKYAKSALAIS